MNSSAWKGRPGSPFGHVLAVERKERSTALWHLQVVTVGTRIGLWAAMQAALI